MQKFDEMYTQLPYEFFSGGAQIREHYKIYDAWLARQPGDMMAKRREEAEMIFRRGMRDAGLARGAPQRQPGNAVTRNDAFGRRKQCRAQVAVMIGRRGLRFAACSARWAAGDAPRAAGFGSGTRGSASWHYGGLNIDDVNFRLTGNSIAPHIDNVNIDI